MYLKLSFSRPEEIRKILTELAIHKGNGCWEWPRCKLPRGYGAIVIDQKSRIVSRVSAWAFNGFNLDPKFSVCHICDNPPCFNPSHLFVGTHAENMGDMARKNRRKSENNWTAKLNDTSALFVKYAIESGEKRREIAKRFGISIQTVSHIANKRSWKHVQCPVLFGLTQAYITAGDKTPLESAVSMRNQIIQKAIFVVGAND